MAAVVKHIDIKGAISLSVIWAFLKPVGAINIAISWVVIYFVLVLTENKNNVTNISILFIDFITCCTLYFQKY